MLGDALRCVDEALRRDPDSLDARRLKGVIALSLTGDMRTALEELGFVLSRNPEDTEGALWYAMALGFVDRMSRARELSDRMMKVDPLNTASHVVQSWLMMTDGRFDEALSVAHAEHRREPNMFATFTYGQALIHTQRWGEMDELAETLRTGMTSAPLYRILLAQVHAHRGERKEVEALIDENLMKTVSRDLQYPWQIAISWLLLGEKDKALSLLETAVSRGFWNSRFLGELDPYLAPLRDDPRFVALLEKARAEAERV